MSTRKYVFKPRFSDDEELDFSLPQCLAISPSIQMRDIPTNGEEYLLNVMNERQKTSTLYISKQDYFKLPIKQTLYLKQEPKETVPDELKPTLEWQNIQVADFSEVRMYLNRLQANKCLWHENLKKIRLDYTEDDEWRDFFANYESTVSCVLGLRHVAIDYGIEYLNLVIEATEPGKTIDHKTGQWIYAFLACTRQPLVSGTISQLRDLAKRCAEIRSRINPKDENAISAVAPLNLFICLVGRYFGQYDLAD
ncbi:hypothetical protein K1T71_001774 [Dendrolimus kikuchii]|uniref:Uncharacterized protein n=1 Tax=Dendrolimus kikuchii TaxID=765133 RepID=A0ACC1DF44_9NEOP|nr:hypothetical protein K1T71_001774 [Dendrolimus kikuchii]